MREAWLNQHYATAGAMPARFGNRRPKRTIVVDLAEDIGSPRWWRGFTLLGALSGALLLAGPGVAPLPGQQLPQLERAAAAQWRASGVGALSAGSPAGMRMAPGTAVEPIAAAPERARVELVLTVGSDGLGPALVRAGASYADAVRAHALAKAPAGTSIALVLGRRESGRRPVERIAFRAGIDSRVVITKGADGLAVQRIAIPVDTRPLRIRGRAGDGLYWALRSAGAPARVAADYLKALSEELDVGEIGAGDRFDLVLESRRSADGRAESGMLLYAGLVPEMGAPLQLVRWSAGGKPVWVNAATIGEERHDDGAMAWPVAAPITSRFGLRVHPILRFARMHRGIDFGARWGTPIVAAADGQVTKAGWAGGYGRQVRIAHGDGIATSYSHMSSMIVAPGGFVRRGQLIGYVGSSGLSTGPHLHYEVYRGGVAVDPMSVRFAGSRPIDPAVVRAIKARVRALLGAQG